MGIQIIAIGFFKIHQRDQAFKEGRLGVVGEGKWGRIQGRKRKEGGERGEDTQPLSLSKKNKKK